MKRYESYKDSGVKWLGEIPGHWEVRKIKYTFKERSQKGFPKLSLLSATQQYGVIKKDDYENRTVVATKGLDTLKLVCKNDFVISLRSFEGGIEMSHEEGIISPAYTILIPKKIEPSYFRHLGKTPVFINLLKMMVTGIREGQNIDYNKLRTNLIPIPPKSEQTAIANYLDSVTSKIDEAISQQQKMIDLLNERKQIIIQNAVTKGLDPNAKMKDSGVEWIGEIPEDWEVLKLRRISKIFTGKTPSTSNPRYFHSEDIEWFTPGDFNGIELKSSKRKISNYAIKDNASILYPKHSIFIIGIGGTIGKVAFCDLEASCNQQINVIILNENANYRYITYLLQNSNSEIMKNANLSTLPIINQQKTGDLKIILPNINEQSLIVDYINNEIKPLDSSISQCNKMISLLQERKQIIINDVVTGKVKVI